jgi:integrase
MPKKVEDLTALAVSKKGPGLHSVGGVGLYLQVLPGGAGRSWILRFTSPVTGRRRDMGLGSYPDVSLAEARDAATEARKAIAHKTNPVDPIEAARAAKIAARAAKPATITFADAARAYVRAHEPSWKNPKHVAQWTSTLERYAYPVIGKLSVRDVDVSHIIAILEPIWSTKSETATRVRGRIESVLDWARARGFRAGANPALWRGHLDKLLPSLPKTKRVKHHRSLPFREMGAFMARLRQADGGTAAKALEFAILTAARSGEVRGARWPEIDRAGKVWTVPGSRMKAGKPHRVMLSAAALELLDKLLKVAGTDLLFPSADGGQLSDMALNEVCRRMKIDAVPHGFRSSFSTWARETTAHPRDMVEMALAHTIDDKTEEAYFRGDLAAKRIRLMRDWASYLSKVDRTGEGQVLAFSR